MTEIISSKPVIEGRFRKWLFTPNQRHLELLPHLADYRNIRVFLFGSEVCMQWKSVVAENDYAAIARYGGNMESLKDKLRESDKYLLGPAFTLMRDSTSLTVRPVDATSPSSLVIWEVTELES